MIQKKSGAITLAVFVSVAVATSARASEIDELKATIESMQKSMEQMQARITELEQENHKRNKDAPASRHSEFVGHDHLGRTPEDQVNNLVGVLDA